jgi:hypothetical protein
MHVSKIAFEVSSKILVFYIVLHVSKIRNFLEGAFHENHSHGMWKTG